VQRNWRRDTAGDGAHELQAQKAMISSRAFVVVIAMLPPLRERCQRPVWQQARRGSLPTGAGRAYGACGTGPGCVDQQSGRRR